MLFYYTMIKQKFDTDDEFDRWSDRQRELKMLDDYFGEEVYDIYGDNF